MKEKKQKDACPACCAAEGSVRIKQRTDREYKALIHRLNRIEGQIRGIRGMVENGVYCIDILTQVAAANAALNAFTKVLLSSHIQSCVKEDVAQGGSEKLDELVRTLPKLMK